MRQKVGYIDECTRIYYRKISTTYHFHVSCPLVIRNLRYIPISNEIFLWTAILQNQSQTESFSCKGCIPVSHYIDQHVEKVSMIEWGDKILVENRERYEMRYPVTVHPLGIASITIPVKRCLADQYKVKDYVKAMNGEGILCKESETYAQDILVRWEDGSNRKGILKPPVMHDPLHIMEPPFSIHIRYDVDHVVLCEWFTVTIQIVNKSASKIKPSVLLQPFQDTETGVQRFVVRNKMIWEGSLCMELGEIAKGDTMEYPFKIQFVRSGRYNIVGIATQGRYKLRSERIELFVNDGTPS